MKSVLFAASSVSMSVLVIFLILNAIITLYRVRPGILIVNENSKFSKLFVDMLLFGSGQIMPVFLASLIILCFSIQSVFVLICLISNLFWIMSRHSWSLFATRKELGILMN